MKPKARTQTKARASQPVPRGRRVGRPRVIVVGGQCKGVGKTTLVEGILRAMPEMEWLAVKVTPHRESVPERQTPVGRAAKAAGDGISIRDENERDGRSDTSRFLAAGARRAIWVECEPERLPAALTRLRKELKGARNVIIESDSAARHWKPDSFIMVLDPRREDFRESARQLIGKVDVFVYRDTETGSSQDSAIGGSHMKQGACRILQRLGEELPRNLKQILRHPKGGV